MIPWLHVTKALPDSVLQTVEKPVAYCSKMSILGICNTGRRDIVELLTRFTDDVQNRQKLKLIFMHQDPSRAGVCAADTSSSNPGPPGNEKKRNVSHILTWFITMLTGFPHRLVTGCNYVEMCVNPLVACCCHRSETFEIPISYP